MNHPHYFNHNTALFNFQHLVVWKVANDMFFKYKDLTVNKSYINMEISHMVHMDETRLNFILNYPSENSLTKKYTYLNNLMKSYESSSL
jgi:hypothetical protein